MARKSGKGGFIVVFNDIPALMALVEATSRSAPMRVCKKIVSSAKGYAPVDTGYLRSTIHAESISVGKEAVVEVDAEYAAFQEYGTYKMAAHPFLTPAVRDHESEFFDEIIGPCFGKGL